MYYDLSDHSNIPRSQKWKIIIGKHGEFQENSVGQSKMHSDCHSNTHPNSVSVHSLNIHSFIHILWALSILPSVGNDQMLGAERRFLPLKHSCVLRGWCIQRQSIRAREDLVQRWWKGPRIMEERPTNFARAEERVQRKRVTFRCRKFLRKMLKLSGSGRSYGKPCNSLTQGCTQHRGWYAAVSVYFSNVF